MVTGSGIVWLVGHGCCTSLQYRVPRSQSGVRRSANVHDGPVPRGRPNPWALLSGCAVTVESALVSLGSFARVTTELGWFAAGQARYRIIPRPEPRRPAYLFVPERR
jgi:hypothetical protein